MNKVVKATAGLFIVTIISKILGFLRETVLVSTYGTSAITDAYITAMNIPSVLFNTIAVALATTLIPLFFQIESDKGKKASLDFLNNVISIVILISLILSILGFIFAQPLTKIFAMNFSGEKLSLATQFTRIMIFGIVFIALSNIMTCFLQIKDNFLIPGMMAIPYNIIVVLVILFSKGNMNILAIGTFIGMISQFLFQYPYAVKGGFKFKFKINLKDEYIRKMLTLVLPVSIAVGVNQINNIVDRSLASTLGDGMITVLNSANKLNDFATGLFISSIAIVVYPLIAKLSVDENKEDLLNIVRTSINVIIILVIPVTIGAIVLSQPIVKVVFERGSFDATSTSLTATALRFYCIGMIGSGITTILNKVFYAFKDTNTPMKIAGMSVALNIILNVILSKIMGHGGLAFATSISAIVGSAILIRSLVKKIGNFGIRKILDTILKCILSASLMGVVVNITYIYIFSICNIEILSILISVLIGAVVYGISAILLKIEEVGIIILTIKDKLKKKSKLKTVNNIGGVNNGK